MSQPGEHKPFALDPELEPSPAKPQVVKESANRIQRWDHLHVILGISRTLGAFQFAAGWNDCLSIAQPFPEAAFRCHLKRALSQGQHERPDLACGILVRMAQCAHNGNGAR